MKQDEATESDDDADADEATRLGYSTDSDDEDDVADDDVIHVNLSRFFCKFSLGFGFIKPSRA